MNAPTCPPRCPLTALSAPRGGSDAPETLSGQHSDTDARLEAAVARAAADLRRARKALRLWRSQDWRELGMPKSAQSYADVPRTPRQTTENHPDQRNLPPDNLCPASPHRAE